MSTPLLAVILAAGEGTRMNSETPKVLHEIAGQPMIDYALENARVASPSKIFVVVGAQAEAVTRHIGKNAQCILQKQRLGTGHAVQQAIPQFKGFKGNVLIVSADACLMRPSTVAALKQFHSLQGSEATLLTARVQDPYGYGRILRKQDGRVERIVEEKDANEVQRRVNEINAGVYLFKASALMAALATLKAANAKKEYYLTDTILAILEKGGSVQALMVPDSSEVLGVNDRGQLTHAHRLLNARRVEEHQRNGVTFLDPERVEIAPVVLIGKDTVVEGQVRLGMGTVIGEGCRVESGSVLVKARLGRDVTVKSSRIFESELGDGCDAGPWAYIRGGCRLEKGVHVGTNAELKNTKAGTGTKIGHFSYVGDAQLGKNVNVGAGCVFANFNGKSKSPCIVGDDVFLGSNSTLVAPVKIGKGAVVGAGAVVTKDVAPKAKVVGVPAAPLKAKK